LAPEDNRLGLPLLEERLPFWVQGHIGSVVVEKILLDLPSIGLLYCGEEIGIPVVRADQFWLC
jgi:hypothetical protein